ncbi:MAG: ABC transporter ATP-binding protein, partial [Chitinophagaceae bacterium]|nr:ABC transporter ATP-binding protein [Chitinophagaceae bacterium]
AQLAREGKTIFYCSHMMDVVEKVSDLIILINQGKVIAQGTINELREQSGKNTSLEQIFSQLTSDEPMSNAATNILKAFQTSNPIE